MKNILTRAFCAIGMLFILVPGGSVHAQTNLLINGGFEDINTCKEYKSECGVEAWFYMQDVQAQMLLNENNRELLGINSYAIYSKWTGYKDFTPVIGTLLPCGLQKGNTYTFKGLISAKLNPKLMIKPGVCLGEFYYVPRRPFSKELKPMAITVLDRKKGTSFYEFEYSFTANGSERYLTFGTYIEEDTSVKGRKLNPSEPISFILDNFQLIPADKNEGLCDAYKRSKADIYDYNLRHKEMDYALYGKGELPIEIPIHDKSFTTKTVIPPPVVVRTDTLRLGDVFFDFNKSQLKTNAVTMLSNYFVDNPANKNIDSIHIDGHTDSIGSDQRNLTLSRERSEAVKDWFLLNNVINASQVIIHPFGRSKPIASNRTSAGRALNRRVEIVIFRKTLE